MRALGKVHQLVLATLIFGGIALLPSQSSALTPAGTIIGNTATANYNLGGSPQVASDTVNFTVQEVIDTTLSWTDAGNIIVATPDTDQVATLELANTGNGSEQFSITLANVSSPTDEFDYTLAADVQVYLEDGTTVGFQDTEDTLYTFGVNDPTLAAETSLTFYLVTDIPAALAHLDEGHIEVTIDSLTAGASGSAAGTVLTNLGDGGTIDAIVGTSQAEDTATAIYQVSTVTVDIVKTIETVLDEFGGTALIPNAEVTYRITVTITGGIAEGLTITDPIPAETTYVANSITLDTVAQTDASDFPTDNTDYNVTAANTVTVVLGDTAGGTVHVIDITVTID